MAGYLISSHLVSYAFSSRYEAATRRHNTVTPFPSLFHSHPTLDFKNAGLVYFNSKSAKIQYALHKKTKKGRFECGCEEVYCDLIL